MLSEDPNVINSIMNSSVETNCKSGIYLGKICRVCLKTVKEDTEIFSLDFVEPKSDSTSIATKLSRCCPELDLRINPKAVICKTCNGMMSAAYRFKGKYEKKLQQINAHSALLSIVLYSKMNLIKRNNLKQTGKVEKDGFKLNAGSLVIDDHDYCATQNRIKSTNRNNLNRFKYTCPTCNYKTNHILLIKQHARLHFKNKSYRCPQCEFTTKHAKLLRDHKFNHVEHFICSKCNYKTVDKLDLKLHMFCHNDNEPFKCIKCNYKTTNIHCLKQHLFKHSQNKPFKCSKCSYGTKQKSSLKIHLLIHDEKKFLKCSKCNYGTKHKYFLRQHKKIHARNPNFRRLRSKSKAARAYCLRKYIQAYAVNEPFKCKQCSYKTTRHMNFLNHFLSHGQFNVFKKYLEAFRKARAAQTSSKRKK